MKKCKFLSIRNTISKTLTNGMTGYNVQKKVTKI